MKQWLTKSRLWAFFALVLLSISGAVAQTPIPPTAVPPPFERRFFTLGGRTDNVIFFAKTKEAQTLDVQEALIASFRIYQPLFGSAAGDGTGRIPFQVVVWVTGLDSTQVLNGSKSAIADADFDDFTMLPVTADIAPILDPQVCQIRVFNAFSKDKDKLATIAHEFAHCYQTYYNFDAERDSTYRNWWIEGGAEWLASLVYPEGFPNGLSKEFRYDLDIIRESYTNVYFWLFVASPKGAGSNQAAVNFMIGVPQDAQTHRDYLDRVNPAMSGTDTFHEWMLALLRGEILYDPPIDVPGFTTESAAGGTVILSTLPFSGDRVKIQNIQVDKGNRAIVTATGLTTPHYGVSMLAGSTWVRLGEGIQAEFCPKAGELELVVSRANGVQDDRTEFTLTFTQTPSPTPCDKESNEDEDANCAVGTWVVDQFPVSIAIPGSTVDTSDFTFTFGTDGSVEIFYGLTATLDARTMRADVPFSGTYTVGENGQMTGFSAKIAPGGTYTATDNGAVTDFTKPFYEYSQVFDPWGPAGEVLCDEDSMSWTTQDGMGSFNLTRISP